MTMPAGIYLGIPDAEYFATPGLSSTGIKHLLRSPAHYQHSLKHRTDSTTFDVGHAAHAKILGVGLGVVEYGPEHITPSGAISTKAATVEWAKDQRAAGLTPVSPDQVREVDAMAEAVLAHATAGPLLEGGDPEVSLLWDDAATGVRCRGRIDYLHSETLAVDLKTCASADPRDFDRTAVKYGYGEQAAHYMNGLTATRGDIGTRFLHVLVEKTAPHLVSVVELDDVFLFIAQARVRRAIDTYAACQAANDWPGYPDSVQTIAAPGWYGDDDTEEMEVH